MTRDILHAKSPLRVKSIDKRYTFIIWTTISLIERLDHCGCTPKVYSITQQNLDKIRQQLSNDDWNLFHLEILKVI